VAPPPGSSRSRFANPADSGRTTGQREVFYKRRKDRPCAGPSRIPLHGSVRVPWRSVPSLGPRAARTRAACKLSGCAAPVDRFYRAVRWQANGVQPDREAIAILSAAVIAGRGPNLPPHMLGEGGLYRNRPGTASLFFADRSACTRVSNAAQPPLFPRFPHVEIFCPPCHGPPRSCPGSLNSLPRPEKPRIPHKSDISPVRYIPRNGNDRRRGSPLAA
jgi:hypothetical protein